MLKDEIQKLINVGKVQLIDGEYYVINQEERPMVRRRRGRPTGYKMSEESKKQISESKKGQKHTEKTKNKISDGVKKFHEVGAPIDILMKTDLNNCAQMINSGYVSVCIPNPEVGEPSYHQRLHVAIMEQKLRRKLSAGEEVHHWGDPLDNRPHLLTVTFNKKEHMILDRIKREELIWTNLFKKQLNT